MIKFLTRLMDEGSKKSNSTGLKPFPIRIIHTVHENQRNNSAHLLTALDRHRILPTVQTSRRSQQFRISKAGELKGTFSVSVIVRQDETKSNADFQLMLSKITSFLTLN